jgi:hypothetical protein
VRRLYGPDVQGPIEFQWMLERLSRCNALIWSTAEGVLAAGASVVLDIGAMRRADRDRVDRAPEIPLWPRSRHPQRPSMAAYRALHIRL